MTRPSGSGSGWRADWPVSPPPSSMNGHAHDLALGVLLGEIRTESHRQTEILLGVLHHVQELPDRLAERLEMKPASPPIQQSIMAAPVPQVTAPPARVSRMSEATELLKALPPLLRALIPLAIIAGVIWGRIGAEHSEMVKQLFGLGP